MVTEALGAANVFFEEESLLARLKGLSFELY